MYHIKYIYIYIYIYIICIYMLNICVTEVVKLSLVKWEPK